MKLLLFFAFVSLTLFDQFALIIGVGYDMNNPAFTTLVHSFALKAKDIDKKTNWELKLNKLFNLPDQLLRNKKIDSIEWMNEVGSVTNYVALVDALNRIPKDFQANGIALIELIRRNLIPVVNGDSRIKEIYIRFFNQTIVEPSCRKLDGFVAALDKFNGKKLKATRLKAVSEEYKNMVRKYDEITASLQTKLDRTVITRREYAQQFQLTKLKINQYEPPSRRSDANRNNVDYDFDYLKMLQQVSSDLRTTVETLEMAVNAVESTLIQYFDQRILWAEYLVETPFFHAPAKRSAIPCFSGSKVQE